MDNCGNFFVKIIVLTFFITILPPEVFALVIINEIAWMGTINFYNDEWIELYNPTGSAVNLEGWILKTKDGTPEISLSGTIPAKGFYLLERTNDNSVLNISADQIYTGALKNEGEHLEFYDNLGNLIDSVDCSQGWFAGDNQTKQTMERTVQNTWQTSQNSAGTPKAENSTSEKISKPEPEPITEPEPEPQLEPKTEIKTYPSGIVINEILPSPEGPDKTEEWIELKNLNEVGVDISGWKIQDTTGVTNTYVFPEKTKISANGFLILEGPVSKITLNNGGEGLKLFQPNDNLIDEVVMGKALLGQSYNRIDSEWFWSNNLTPGTENIIPKPIEEKISSPTGPAAAEETETPLTTELKKEGKAAIGETFSGRPSLHFLIALIVAIFSAIIILILKKKLKMYYNKNI